MNPSMGFPMEMDKFPGKIWVVSHKPVAVAAGLGMIGIHRNVIHQKFGNWLAASLMNALYNLPVTDLGPYRAIRTELVQELGMREMTFGWPTEMMVKAAKKNGRIAEVPVSWHVRHSGQSKVSGTLRGSLLAAY